MKNFRFLLWNINAGRDADKKMYDFTQVLSVLKKTGFDICCLLEVDRKFGSRSQFDDQVSVLRKQFGGHVFFVPTYQRVYGFLVVSKFPIISSAVHILPTPKINPLLSTREKRRLVILGVNMGSEVLKLYLTHLDFEENNNLAQFVKIKSLLQRDSAEILMLAGDFNNESLPQTIDYPRGLLVNSVKANTYFGSFGQKRLDYVYLSQNIQLSDMVISKEAVSDHKLILQSLKI